MDIYPLNTLGDASTRYNMAFTREADIDLSVHGYSLGRYSLSSLWVGIF